MLKSEDVFKELEEIESVRVGITDKVVKAQLKLNMLIAKLLLNIRANQVTDLRSREIDLIKPQTRDTEK
jgi:hypothetical protein